MVEDPVGDMLARIENGAAAKKLSVTVPFSNVRADIADVLADLGFIADFDVDEDEHEITINPAYTDDGESKICHTRRISRPARRRYIGTDEIPDVRGDYGAVILSTPEGVLTGEKARQQHVGGELLFEIW